MKEVKLTNSSKTALVDDNDYDYISSFKWRIVCCKNKTYVSTGFGPTHLFLHTVLLGVTGVDHIDDNGLNNQRHNLRVANQSQNMANRGKQKNNTTGYKGVFVEKRNGTF